jgi:hypothetical protein
VPSSTGAAALAVSLGQQGRQVVWYQGGRSGGSVRHQGSRTTCCAVRGWDSGEGVAVRC